MKFKLNDVVVNRSGSILKITEIYDTLADVTFMKKSNAEPTNDIKRYNFWIKSGSRSTPSLEEIPKKYEHSQDIVKILPEKDYPEYYL